MLPWHKGGYEDHHGDIEEGLVPADVLDAGRVADATGWDWDDGLVQDVARAGGGGDDAARRDAGAGGGGGGADEGGGEANEGAKEAAHGNDDESVERAAGRT